MMSREKEDNRDDEKYENISSTQTPFTFKRKGRF
jgi:hypothetical protein